MLTDNTLIHPSSKCFPFRPSRNSVIVGIIICVTIISLTITTTIFAVLYNHSKKFVSPSIYSVDHGSIGFPIRLPNDGDYIQFTFLQLNDVYETLPLDQGKKGGLARVAHLRELLLDENSRTYTILSGDFLSPSALSQSIVNGTKLNGRQMIASLNTLGIDFVTFGNHEFDLTERDLISRMNESKFTWISSNVFEKNTTKPFSSSIRSKMIIIENVKILLIGLTIDLDQTYVQIINQTSLIPFVQNFLKDFDYDILIALTHLDLEIDIQLAENLPQIDLILGGHEHEDYYLYRGLKYVPISKADANAFTVYIHRCAFHLNTKQFRVFSTLTQINSQIKEEEKTAQVSNYWFNLGLQAFEQIGFHPNEIVSCLPTDIQLDGRSTSVRNFATSLTDSACQSLLQSTSSNQTKLAVFNSGSIRIDDILRGEISQYDILRVFPFQDEILSLSIPGLSLAKILTNSITMKGSGAFLAYCGINTPDQGKTWFVDQMDISQSNRNYTIGTITYLKKTLFIHPTIEIFEEFNTTQTKALINYLRIKYPPC